MGCWGWVWVLVILFLLGGGGLIDYYCTLCGFVMGVIIIG